MKDNEAFYSYMIVTKEGNGRSHKRNRKKVEILQKLFR